MSPLVVLALAFGAASGWGGHCGWGAEVGVRLALSGGALLIVAGRLAWAGHRKPALAVAIAGMVGAGVGRAAVADAHAWAPSGVNVEALERHVAEGGLLRVAGHVRRDAAVMPGGGVALDVAIQRVWLEGRWKPAPVGARITVGGSGGAAARAAWTRGAWVEMPVATVRRPLPYRNFGLPDAEQEVARRGIRLFGIVKSASLVTTSRAAAWHALPAAMRGHVRVAVGRHVSDAGAAAIVTAILIGDRSALEPRIVRRLQHAGVYHVVAISGGNVGVWLALLLVLPRVAGWGTRSGMLWLAAGLLGFAAVVDGGASVARAVLVAAITLVARWFDVQAPGAQALAAAAILHLAADGLAMHDAGALLSFGAAGTLVWLAGTGRRMVRDDGRVPWWQRTVLAALAVTGATVAIELVLLPITARWFNVVTAAGVVANLLAVPAMALVQLAGVVLVPAATLAPPVADAAGLLAGAAVSVLLHSADVLTVAPWLVREIPPPAAGVLVLYYVGLVGCAAATARRARGRPARAARALGTAIWMACLVWMVTGGAERSAPAPWTWPAAARWHHGTWPREPWLLVTVLDVGQGDATVVRFPSGRTWLVDAGGSTSESFDLGERVTSRALWALGHRTVSRVVVTHAHPDHAAGVPAVLRRLGTRELLTGISVAGDASDGALTEAARLAGVPTRAVRTGESLSEQGVRVEVLQPDAPDWERRRVRNDDSVVLWIRMGDVGFLLPGDVGADAERRWAGAFAAAPVTVLKLPHHGSASSTSDILLATTTPALAVGSMGRGNPFGHPAPSVLRRLDAAGVPLLRTDTVGAIQLATNGRVLLVRTASGLAGSITAWESPHAWWLATPPPSDRAMPHRVARHPRAGALPSP